jgi:hypothetical protein
MSNSEGLTMAAVAHNGKPDAKLEQWLRALAQETQRAYRTWLERYERWCTETGASPDAAASVAAYIEHIVRQGYGVSAVQQLFAALRLKFRCQGVSWRIRSLPFCCARYGARSAWPPVGQSAPSGSKCSNGCSGARGLSASVTGR